MRPSKPVARLSAAERLNFLLTNRIPRRSLTLFMGRFSKLRNPVLRWLSMTFWKLFADDLRLFEAKKARFDSLHDCFIRELIPEARPIDPDPAVLVSPCDAVVGECGDIEDLEVIQAKGFPYTIDDFLVDAETAARYRNGRFVTLRLKSSMYHRFHAPAAGRVRALRYISGDTWNVNPPALKIVERLYCKNERVALELDLDDFGEPVVLVAVAAVLVASVRLHGLAHPLNLRYRGPNRIELDRRYCRGEQIGYFEHGSTIVVLSSKRFRAVEGLTSGGIIRMGQPLLQISADTGTR